MKEKYRLQALLMVKQRMKKRAEILLARAIRELLDEREKLKKLEAELVRLVERWQAARTEMDRAVRSGAAVGEGNVHVNYLRALKEDEAAKEEEIEEQNGVIEEAQLRVARARREYIDAAKELQIMEKHKELWRKKLQGIINRSEAKKLDELGQAIHQLKRWRGEKSVFEV